ncbi:MAG: glycosyltransferase [Candidatus Omnitrophica bacterium]|nr:glycosyltransferase [Candidatus Omnitrophota bacterium]
MITFSSHKPKVSIVIPSYNRARFLPEAIDSVIIQTYRNFEIVVVDDGSTDNTKEIMAEYVKKYTSKVRYFYQENQGEAGARNRGIKESRGEYIAFLDSDDIWVQDKLEIQVRLLADNPDVGLTYGRAKRVNEKGEYLDMKPTQPAIKAIHFLQGKRLTMMTVMVHKKCFSHIGLFDKKLKVGVDTDMWLRLAFKYKIVFLNKILAIMRSHDGNISNDTKEMYAGHIKIIEKLIKEEVPNKFSKKFLKRLLAQNYYLKAVIHYKDDRNFDLALKSSLTALKMDFFVWKKFMQNGDTFLVRVKKTLNPYGMCFLSFFMAMWKDSTT